MPRGPLPRLLLAGLTLLPGAVPAQAIQRCEGPDGRVSYTDTECPRGTRAARAVAPAVPPTQDEQQQARDRAQREGEVAQALAAKRQAAPATPGQSYVTAEEAQRAADCAYLRAELESNRRLRNVLTTRRYYSTEDVEQMDARAAALSADYRRFCTR